MSPLQRSPLKGTYGFPRKPGADSSDVRQAAGDARSKAGHDLWVSRNNCVGTQAIVQGT